MPAPPQSLLLYVHDLGNRFTVLMLGLVVGDRALPLVWAVAAGPAHLGLDRQAVVLERVRGWLPAGAEVLLLADRFSPSAALLALSLIHI